MASEATSLRLELNRQKTKVRAWSAGRMNHQQSQFKDRRWQWLKICLSWLPYPLNNSKLSSYLMLQCMWLCRINMQTVRSGSHESPFQPSWNCIILAFYPSYCMALSDEDNKRDLLNTDALDQWCLQKLLGIKWYHYVRNDEVRWTTRQPHFSAIVKAHCFSLFDHIQH